MSLATAAFHHSSEKITNQLMIRVFEERQAGDIQRLRASRYAIGQDRKPTAHAQGVLEKKEHMLP
jgi:hypothetical protein